MHKFHRCLPDKYSLNPMMELKRFASRLFEKFLSNVDSVKLSMSIDVTLLLQALLHLYFRAVRWIMDEVDREKLTDSSGQSLA